MMWGVKLSSPKHSTMKEKDFSLSNQAQEKGRHKH
jgi:hypothetical protein